MSSVHVALSQRKTNNFKADATTSMYALSTIVAAQAASTAQLGSVFVLAAGGSFALGAAMSTTVTASHTMTDLGKTLVFQIAGDNATIKMQEVKYQTASAVWQTGYVVVENNFNTGALVTVSRV